MEKFLPGKIAYNFDAKLSLQRFVQFQECAVTSGAVKSAIDVNVVRSVTKQLALTVRLRAVRNTDRGKYTKLKLEDV